MNEKERRGVRGEGEEKEEGTDRQGGQCCLSTGRALFQGWASQCRRPCSSREGKYWPRRKKGRARGRARARARRGRRARGRTRPARASLTATLPRQEASLLRDSGRTPGWPSCEDVVQAGVTNELTGTLTCLNGRFMAWRKYTKVTQNSSPSPNLQLGVEVSVAQLRPKPGWADFQQRPMRGRRKFR